MIAPEKRLDPGLSRRELAGRIGTSRNRIYLIENRGANPTPSSAWTACSILLCVPAAKTRLQGQESSGDPERDLAAGPPPEAPNLYDAALALNACVPDDRKVEKDALLADAARELGHSGLTRKLKTALNKALNVEHNAGRLKTDWQRVWRPKK